MSVVDHSPLEFFGTLTGYDEIGIEKEFGTPISDLMQHNMLMGLRALIFTDIKRGKKDADPKQAALRLTVTEVSGYFADEKSDEGDASGEALA